MKLERWIFILILPLAAGWVAGPRPSRAAQDQSRWTAETVLKQMDRAAETFRTLSADLEHSKYTDVVKDTSVETGRILVSRDDKMRIEILQPDLRTILRNGDSLYVYTPKIKRVEQFDLGKNRALVDQYVRLGFGTRGEDLKKGYLLTVLGEETMDARKTLLIELTPKSEKVRSQISKIHMWIDQASWIPVQQKFFETASGDFFVFHYKNIALNLKIHDSRFKPNWPKDVTLLKPRG